MALLLTKELPGINMFRITLSELESARWRHDRSVCKAMRVMVLPLTAYSSGITKFRLESHSTNPN